MMSTCDDTDNYDLVKATIWLSMITYYDNTEDQTDTQRTVDHVKPEREGVCNATVKPLLSPLKSNQPLGSNQTKCPRLIST